MHIFRNQSRKSCTFSGSGLQSRPAAHFAVLVFRCDRSTFWSPVQGIWLADFEGTRTSERNWYVCHQRKASVQLNRNSVVCIETNWSFCGQANVFLCGQRIGVFDTKEICLCNVSLQPQELFCLQSREFLCNQTTCCVPHPRRQWGRHPGNCWFGN